MRYITKRKGFTFIELIIVIVVTTILATITLMLISGQKQKNNIFETSNEMKAQAINIEKAVENMGFYKFNNDYANFSQENFETTATAYMSKLGFKYIGTQFDCVESLDYIDASNADILIKGFIVSTMDKVDSWGNNYKYICFSDENENKVIIIASPGNDEMFSDDMQNGYINAEYDDDIIMVMIQRNDENEQPYKQIINNNESIIQYTKNTSRFYEYIINQNLQEE